MSVYIVYTYMHIYTYIHIFTKPIKNPSTSMTNQWKQTKNQRTAMKTQRQSTKT